MAPYVDTPGNTYHTSTKHIMLKWCFRTIFLDTVVLNQFEQVIHRLGRLNVNTFVNIYVKLNFIDIYTYQKIFCITCFHRTWREVVETDCQAHKLNKQDAMDRSKWRKLTKDVQWPGWMWVGECFFWYRLTRVVPDKRPLNSCVRSHHLQADCQEPGSAPEPHAP